ncbi:MBL fold metallo-hydrolase [Nocardia sp. X0981]
MRRIFPDLWETREFAVPGGPRTHAYLWAPPSGQNILFYAPGNDRDFADLERLGGVARQYLSHQDEAGPVLRAVAERFGSRLHAPAAEADEIEAFAPIDVALDARGVDDAGIDIIPTPGHTPGSTCYLVPGHGGRNYLFTGDTFLRYADGVWRAGYIPGYSDKAGLRAALDILAGVQPDVVVSSGFVEGTTAVHEIDRATWPEYLDQARQELG